MPSRYDHRGQLESLRELRIWLVGSRRLASSLATICNVTAPQEENWQAALKDGDLPAFLLVEAGGLTTGTGEGRASMSELELLLDGCERAAVPRFVWIRDAPISSLDMELIARFDRVFTADRDQLPALEAAGIAAPSLLWTATTLTSDGVMSTDAAARPEPVVWLGGWREEWPPAWRERLTSVLRGAAQRGLRIYRTDGTIAVPGDLMECVVDLGAAADRIALLRRARVVIGADPLVGRPGFTPEVVFDAIACGAAVVTPHDFLSMHDFGIGGTRNVPWRNLIPIVHDGDVTVEEIDRLLQDDQLRREIVEHARRIVVNNHTYAHRLATLASAANLRSIPSAQRMGKHA